MRNAQQNLKPLILACILATMVACDSKEVQSTLVEYIDDTVITTRVKTALFNDGKFRNGEIIVETVDGIVQLSGFVAEPIDSDAAVLIAGNVEGVETVVNSIRLRSGEGAR